MIKALQKSNSHGTNKPKNCPSHNKIYNLQIKAFKLSIYLDIEAMIVAIMLNSTMMAKSYIIRLQLALYLIIRRMNRSLLISIMMTLRVLMFQVILLWQGKLGQIRWSLYGKVLRKHRNQSNQILSLLMGWKMVY